MSHPLCGRVRTFARLVPGLAVLAVLVLPRPVLAQRVVSQAERVISVSRGASALFISPVPLQRFSVGDPGIAEVTIVSPTEVVINGRGLGSTTLLIWDNSSDVKVYSVEVTADAPALERYIRSLLPNEEITVTASGGSITLSGTVKDPLSAQRAVEIARSSGATIIDNLVTPPAVQVKLKVRFAEINRTALRQWAANLSTLNPHKLSDGGDWSGATSADGTIDFLLDNAGVANLRAFIAASSARGDFRSLAEPTIMVLPGREAYFLAGGRFPFPAVQGGGASNAIGIQFEEFGVRLRFTPVITRSGSIRIKVQPEVSSLDFANGLVISGFVIPSILTRRAETEVELKEGQFLAIAGLLDNTTTDNISKIPVLGDIPILGELFRSKNLQQRRTELLVLVTPQLVIAGEATPVPTGEPDRWNWQRPLEKPAPNTPAADSAAAAARSQ